jgi:hypothetical protein
LRLADQEAGDPDPEGNTHHDSEYRMAGAKSNYGTGDDANSQPNGQLIRSVHLLLLRTMTNN